MVVLYGPGPKASCDFPAKGAPVFFFPENILGLLMTEVNNDDFRAEFVLILLPSAL